MRTARPRSRPAAAPNILGALAAAKRGARRFKKLSGVDYGYLYKDGVRTGEVGIRYHVREKRPLRMLDTEQHLPKEVGGIKTDVIEAGYKPHASDPFAPAATLQPGLSIGNLTRQSNGTLGLFVRDRADGALCLLSNWHVLCGDLDARVDDPIVQPGPLFLGPNPAREIGRLRRWISPERQFDGALASVAAGIATDVRLLNGNVAVAGITVPMLGMAVIKAGAASGITHALVDAVGGSYQVPYNGFGAEPRWMIGIRLVPHPNFPESEVSVQGDSGSVWVDAGSGDAVALNFAGEDDVGPLNEYALAHPLPQLCRLLDIEAMR